MNRNAIVWLVVKEKWNWVVGGYENSLSDGMIDAFPSDDEIISMVYQEVINADSLMVKHGYLPVRKDIRFVGKAVILDLVEAYHKAHKQEICK